MTDECMYCRIAKGSIIPGKKCVMHRNQDDYEREDQMEDNKYVVFKAEDYDDPSGTGPTPIDDAVVIRLQDTFAAPALYGYANSIAVAIGILNLHGLQMVAGDLQKTADYFVTMAEESMNRQTKLPD